MLQYFCNKSIVRGRLMTDKKSKVMGRPSFWRAVGYRELRTWRLPAYFADNTLLRTHLVDMPKVLDEMILELEPRKDKARAKEAYQKLLKLKEILEAESDSPRL